MTHARFTQLTTLGWAAFLACSWTWCIGMFLPVLLVRDFGFPGWAVFTVPNVIGAAGMGWVLHRIGSAAALSLQHRRAAIAFSAVTILFHAFFVGWIIRSLVGEAAEVITILAAVAFYLVGRQGKSRPARRRRFAGMFDYRIHRGGVPARPRSPRPHRLTA